MTTYRALLRAVGTVAVLVGPALPAQGQVPPYRLPRVTQTLPLTKFYATPAPLPAGKPGTLIRSEPAYEYSLSYEISAIRILYHSRSRNGKDVAASGVVLLPEGTPPAGGWPVIAWAHDFTGSARSCAPSLLKNLNAGPLLSMYASLGYAVVASDYAGLGTSAPHATLDTQSYALDVIYSVAAASVALPQLGTKWVAVGHSQGGLVAVGVAETENEIRDSGFLGAIALSGVGVPQEIFERLAHGPSRAMLLFLAQGVKDAFPEVRVEELLSEKAIPLFGSLSDSCQAMSRVVLGPEEILKPGWEKNQYVKEFLAMNSPGRKPALGPLLIISGEADPEVPSILTATAVGRLCQQKDRVLLVKYPGLNASAVLRNSVSEQISWIQTQFAGRPAPGNCP